MSHSDPHLGHLPDKGIHSLALPIRIGIYAPIPLACIVTPIDQRAVDVVDSFHR